MTIFIGERGLRFGSYSFAPRVAPTLAAAAFIALTVGLGNWQVNRAAEKEERQALLDSRIRETPLVLTGSVPSAVPLRYRRVRATGEWLADGQVFVDNQVMIGQAGFHVYTPLRIDGSSDAVLVNRGWIARDARYPQAPAVAVPKGKVSVSGMATVPPLRVLELTPQTPTGSVLQNLSIERYRKRTGIPVLPIIVLSDTPAPGLLQVTEKPDAGIAKHKEYALTWFSLAATALALWIVVNVRRRV